MEASIVILGFSDKSNALGGIVDFDNVAGLHAADNASLVYRERGAVKAEDIIGLAFAYINGCVAVGAVRFFDLEAHALLSNVIDERIFVFAFNVARRACHAFAGVDIATNRSASRERAGRFVFAGCGSVNQRGANERVVCKTAGKGENRAVCLAGLKCVLQNFDGVAAEAFSDREPRAEVGAVGRFVEVDNIADTLEREFASRSAVGRDAALNVKAVCRITFHLIGAERRIERSRIVNFNGIAECQRVAVRGNFDGSSCSLGISKEVVHVFFANVDNVRAVRAGDAEVICRR